MSAEAVYLHGTSPTEQGRLSLLNRLLNEAAMRELAIRPGERIVDFGSGLAQLSLDMALASGTRLVGIERSEEQLARAVRHPLLDLRQGDVLDPPLREREWGSCDLARVPAQLRSARLRSVHRPAVGLAAARSRRSACTLHLDLLRRVRR